MIGDADFEVSKLYGMLPGDTSGDPTERTPADNQTVRNVFVIGPDKKIKLILVYPMTTGHNFDKVLRVVDSLPADRHAQGGDARQLAAGRRRDHRQVGVRRRGEETYPDGWESPRPYIRIVPEPRWGRGSAELAGDRPRGALRLLAHVAERARPRRVADEAQAPEGRMRPSRPRHPARIEHPGVADQRLESASVAGRRDQRVRLERPAVRQPDGRPIQGLDTPDHLDPAVLDRVDHLPVHDRGHGPGPPQSREHALVGNRKPVLAQVAQVHPAPGPREGVGQAHGQVQERDRD